MTTFERDDSLVVATADGGGSRQIETSGPYVGVFTQAKQRVAKTGTKGIEFSFEATDGASARYMTLWVERANGERIAYSYGVLSGLMLCLGLKSITSAQVVSEEWDASVGARVPTKIEAYPDLINRQIGVLLQREEQEWDGKLRTNMRIVDFFHPASRQTPSEVLGGTGATGQLDQLIASLKDRIVRAPPPAAMAAPVVAAAVAAAPSPTRFGQPAAIDLGDDDIPF